MSEPDDIAFRRSTASASALAEHLRACDTSFIPSLSARVDIDVYAERLTVRAERFEAWQESRLAGVVAVYWGPDNEAAFISNVSVDPNLRGRGIARRLLLESRDEARRRAARRMRLEVGRQNAAALNLYETLGFRRSENASSSPDVADDTFTLVLEL